MTALHFLLNAGILIYGGVCDYRRREIPNVVPLVLLLTGLLFGGGIPLRLLALCLTAGVFLLLDRITGGGAPGGDFKLMCSLAFSASLHIFLATLLLAAVGAWLLGKLKGRRGNWHVPWCSYVAPAYLLASALFTMI